jgi:Ca-activated chloride channel family protein
MIKHLKYLFIIGLLGLFATNVVAQTSPTRILFVLDGSGSMVAKMGDKPRINIAKRVLSKLMDSLGTKPNVQVALRVYGHTKTVLQHDCGDTRLEVPFAEDNIDAIKESLLSIKPKGYTLIAKSLMEAANDFPDAKGRNIIILITDGMEECDGDPCAISEALQKKGIILRPFIVGMGTDDKIFKDAFSCVGTFLDAKSEADFENILNIIISQTLNETSSQVNLIDDTGFPFETNVGMTIYDAQSGYLLHDYVHTMNAFGLPDTLYLDPMSKYDFVVHTLPPSTLINYSLTAGRHNIIPIRAGQGTLNLVMGGLTKYGRLQAIVRQHDSSTTLNAQEFNHDTKYRTGTYDLEILTLPRINLRNVKIRQNQTTKIEIPNPGKLDLRVRTKISGAIYRTSGGKTTWVLETKSEPKKQEILLQPGNYTWMYRAAGEARTIYTREVKFTISSGITTEIKQ